VEASPVFVPGTVGEFLLSTRGFFARCSSSSRPESTQTRRSILIPKLAFLGLARSEAKSPWGVEDGEKMVKGRTVTAVELGQPLRSRYVYKRERHSLDGSGPPRRGDLQQISFLGAKGRFCCSAPSRRRIGLSGDRPVFWPGRFTINSSLARGPRGHRRARSACIRLILPSGAGYPRGNALPAGPYSRAASMNHLQRSSGRPPSWQRGSHLRKARTDWWY